MSKSKEEEWEPQQSCLEDVIESKCNAPAITTPTSVYRGKHSGVNIVFEVYGELSEQAVKNFNRVFNDTLDDSDKRHHTASA